MDSKRKKKGAIGEGMIFLVSYMGRIKGGAYNIIQRARMRDRLLKLA